MKTYSLVTSLIVLSALLIGCEDERELSQPISIQFDASQQSIIEDDDSDVTITLILSKEASADGIVKLQVSDESRSRLQTTPAHVDGLVELPFDKGTRRLQFKVKAINNTLTDGNAMAEIQIKPSSLFVAGEKDTFRLTIQDDDGVPASSTVNFMRHDESVSENSTETMEYKIQLSTPVAIDSKIVIDISSANTTAFITNPVAENGKLTLLAPAGTTELSFSLNTVNNAELNGHAEVVFSIFSTEGSIIKGTHTLQKLIISDDELSNKLKGYESVGGVDAEKRFYEYDVKGRIAKVNWETYTGFTRSGTDTYFYDDQDRLVTINKHIGTDIHFQWNNGRIERSEVYKDGVLKEYATYAYDELGNIAGIEPYHKQSDGSFKKGLFLVYLYFYDGNIYKALLYQEVAGQEEPVLVSTRTYDHYLSNPAPISMFEIIPGVKSQKNLAGSYRVEQNDSDFTYTLTYEFRSDGLPTKRTASSSNDTQTVVYHYY